MFSVRNFQEFIPFYVYMSINPCIHFYEHKACNASKSSRCKSNLFLVQFQLDTFKSCLQIMLTWGRTFFDNAFSVLKFLKVIFSFILHPLILRRSMCYGSRRGPLPNNTSCHLIAKLRKVIIILGGPTGRSPFLRNPCL